MGLSGGIDSVCLLRTLAELPQTETGRLEVLHVDHGLRPESAGDAAFCRDLAAELGLVFHPVALPPGSLGKGNVQAEARRLRRQVLETKALERGLAGVALGHNADDQAETVLFRLLRGVGPRGLQGMSPWSPPYLRPLLGVSRAGIREVVDAKGWAYREDPSNASDRYARNRLRHGLLPALEAIHPGARRSLLRLASLARDDDRLLSRLACGALGDLARREPEGLRMPVAELRGLDPALRRRVFLAAWEAVGGDPSRLEAAHLQEVESLLAAGRAHRRAPIPGPQRLVRSYGDLWALSFGADGRFAVDMTLEAMGRHALPDSALEVVWARDPAPQGVPAVGVLGGRGAGGLRVKSRDPGDRLEVGSGRTIKLKDLLLTARVPLWRRDRCLLVGDGRGFFGLLAPGWAWGGGGASQGQVWLSGEAY